MRNRLQLAFGVALVLLTASVPLLAHHGAAQFDVGKVVMVKGTVVEWFWANPHCFLRFDVTNIRSGGALGCRGSSGPNILPQGFTKQSFKVGDEVTVTLEPVRTAGRWAGF